MRKVFIGSRPVAALGFGTYNFGVRSSSSSSEAALVREAVELGVELIDTATMYGNEAFLGRALQGIRDKVFLVSKVLPEEADLKGARCALEHSLSALKTDHLDLYLLHWQGSVPLAETCEAFAAFKKEGLILNWGLSNVDLPAIKRLGEKADDLAALEVLYNPTARGMEFDLLPFARENEKAVIAYSPLGEGRSALLKHPAILGVARRHAVSAAQVLIAFSLSDQTFISIPKCSSREHLYDNLKAADLVFDKEDWALLDDAFPRPAHKVPLKLGW